jgi:hypothetical protein
MFNDQNVVMTPQDFYNLMKIYASPLAASVQSNRKRNYIES